MKYEEVLRQATGNDGDDAASPVSWPRGEDAGAEYGGNVRHDP